MYKVFQGVLGLCLTIGVVQTNTAAARDHVKPPRTMTFERTEIITGKKPTVQNWYFQFPAKMRRDAADRSATIITDHELGSTLILNHKDKTAMETPSRKSTKKEPVDLFRDMFDVSRDIRNKDRDIVVDGKAALAFQHEQLAWSRVTWIDPESNRPIRITYSFRPPTKAPATHTSEKFRYDEELVKSLFDIAVPKGYKVIAVPGAVGAQFGPLQAD